MVKTALRKINAGLGDQGGGYGAGYFVAHLISWVGVVLFIIAAIAAFYLFVLIPYGARGIAVRISFTAPAIAYMAGGLLLLLFGQMAKAVFDISLKLQRSDDGA
ncbi:hypothetical protein [Amorphus sp. 3PC139-8]|uniref:hypothetical protein n=1 Tax=Amorphus sp. 3PC139-8 TaxID=2735676 RepID=UPI00345D369F